MVDYPDEDIEPLQQEEIACTLQEEGDGAAGVAVYGRAGAHLKKASVRRSCQAQYWENLLCSTRFWGYERAIVTDVAGTTRDTVEEKCSVAACCCAMTDTAGIETEDTVEKMV